LPEEIQQLCELALGCATKAEALASLLAVAADSPDPFTFDSLHQWSKELRELVDEAIPLVGEWETILNRAVHGKQVSCWGKYYPNAQRGAVGYARQVYSKMGGALCEPLFAGEGRASRTAMMANVRKRFRELSPPDASSLRAAVRQEAAVAALQLI